MPTRTTTVTPSAARLTESLRDIGYDFPSAVADLVDNSIAAGATRVEVVVEFDGADSRVFIVDDGVGMSANQLVEALRFGSRRAYAKGELGRYGLGLKTASLSQCRRLSVLSRRAPTACRITGRSLDLDLNVKFDDWLVVDPGKSATVARAQEWLSDAPGTVVVWEALDRVLPEKNVDGGWARRRLDGLRRKTIEHLAMVFHRYLEGLPDGRTVTLLVNGEKVRPWNPFALDEPGTNARPVQRFELVHGRGVGYATLRGYLLPARDRFSTHTEFERLAGPLKWNRQQGLYVYRADRLVQWGGWAGLRAIDEHTKLARAALEFDTDLDECFNINVAKMRVTLPAQLRQGLERAVNELCVLANDSYRKASPARGRRTPEAPALHTRAALGLDAGLALRAAAMDAGELEAFRRIVAALKAEDPEIAESLGL
ncbi:MAG: ATP-binding protein [Sporichthyaceae bacterium]